MTKTLLRFIIWSAKWIVLVVGYGYNLYWLVESYVRQAPDGYCETYGGCPSAWVVILGTILGLVVTHLIAWGLGAIYKRLPKGTGVPRIAIAFLWTIKWTSKAVGTIMFWIGWPLILAYGLGFILILVSALVLKDDDSWIPDLCNGLMLAIREGTVNSPVDAAEFELDWWVPFWNGSTATVLAPGSDTGQDDLGYGTRQVDVDRLLAKNFCPNCHVYRWAPEQHPVPATCTCRWCGTAMEPIYENWNGKPVHRSAESKVSSTGTSWGTNTTTLD